MLYYSKRQSSEVLMNTARRSKYAGIAACQLLVFFTVIYLVFTKQYGRLPMAFCTILLSLLPLMAERFFRCDIALPFYIFCLLYSVGPMLGQCWKLYYTVSWWDRILHFAGGIAFAVLGIFLFQKFASGKDPLALILLFGFCFSVAAAGIWEFIEFGADTLFGMDMQDDTVIFSLRSYLLGTEAGVMGSIDDISSVAVNGAPLLPDGGYIDIGIIDTMMDMLLGSLGALLTCIYFALSKLRHFPFRLRGESEKKVVESFEVS